VGEATMRDMYMKNVYSHKCTIEEDWSG
jgi:hypothetical protein